MRKTLDVSKKCIRVNMIPGGIGSKQGDFPAAVAAYGAIEQQNHAYLGMVGEKLYGVYTAQEEQEEGLNIFIDYMETFPDLDLINVIYEKSLLLKGEGPATEATVEFVRRKPDLNSVYRLLDLKLNDMDLAWKADAGMMRAVVGHQL